MPAHGVARRSLHASSRSIGKIGMKTLGTHHAEPRVHAVLSFLRARVRDGGARGMHARLLSGAARAPEDAAGHRDAERATRRGHGARRGRRRGTASEGRARRPDSGNEPVDDERRALPVRKELPGPQRRAALHLSVRARSRAGGPRAVVHIHRRRRAHEHRGDRRVDAAHRGEALARLREGRELRLRGRILAHARRRDVGHFRSREHHGGPRDQQRSPIGDGARDGGRESHELGHDHHDGPRLARRWPPHGRGRHRADEQQPPRAPTRHDDLLADQEAARRTTGSPRTAEASIPRACASRGPSAGRRRERARTRKALAV